MSLSEEGTLDMYVITLEREVFQNEKPQKKVESNSGGTFNSVHDWSAYTISKYQ